MELLDYYRKQKISRRYQTIQTLLEEIRGELPDDQQESVDKLQAAVDGLLKNAGVSVPDSSNSMSR